MIYLQEELHHGLAVAALHKEVFPIPANGVSAQLRRLSPPLATTNILAYDNRSGHLAGSIRGFAVNAGGVKAALVSPLAVHPLNQGKKYPDFWNDEACEKSLGRSLVDRFCLNAQQAGCEMVVLKCSTPESMDFYRRNGFYPMGWTKVEWPKASEAPAAMVRPLVAGVFNRAKGLVTAGLIPQPLPRASTPRLQALACA